MPGNMMTVFVRLFHPYFASIYKSNAS